MLKKGFTLSELLITLAIVGIVAAIAAPGIVGMMPDKKKMIYMKAYNTLTTLTNDILDDPSLYWTTYDNNGEPNCAGLRCAERPLDNDYGIADAAEKYPRLLASKMNLVSEWEGQGRIGECTSADGIRWQFLTEETNNNDIPGGKEFIVNITIDVNPGNDNDANAENNCTYDPETCTTPERFIFRVDNDGGITAVDRLGQAFLRNPTDMHSVSEDKEVANDLEEID